MSHLAPTRSVRVTRGGAALGPTQPAVPTIPDTSWDGLIGDLATALGFADPTEFATKVDEVVEALALIASVDIEVARTSTRAALLGDTGMVTGLIPIDLTPARVDEVLAVWLDEPASDGDQLMGRLAILHDELVRPPADPVAPDAEAGEGSDGSVGSLLGAAPAAVDVVPTNAVAVANWIAAADSDDTIPETPAHRARLALEVEQARDGGLRKTVMAAIEAATGG